MKQLLPSFIARLIERTNRNVHALTGDIVRASLYSKLVSVFDEATVDLYRRVLPFTMTSLERVAALRQSVKYIVTHKIPGDIVECGVWRGGSVMAIAWTLLEHNTADRNLYLFDTFEGMPPPTDVDVDHRGEAAAELLKKENKDTSHVWAYSGIDEVKRNMRKTGYDPQRIVFVRGKVEDTLPERAPRQISLLRLDTDWYESTYAELIHLYSRLSVGGVLILDDYGHWAGARRAVDQFIRENNLRLLLNPIDYSGRICVKIDP
jgi:O-methyltransferase